MPNEKFYQPPNPSGDASPFGMVAWARDMYVNLGVFEGGDYDEGDFTRPGYIVELKRADINRLIRTLRKARDQAFGADA